MSNSNSDIDNRIIQRLRQSDKKALTELYHTYWQALFVSCYNVLKNKELCEDIIQDIFMSIWKNREKLNINISLKSYLYACTRYQVYNLFRKNKEKTRIALFDELDKRFQYASPETEMMHKELVQQINSFVETLPKKCQKVYRLSREEQLSHKEISSRLNISTKTVENHITKALQLLRIALGSMLCFILLL